MIKLFFNHFSLLTVCILILCTNCKYFTSQIGIYNSNHRIVQWLFLWLDNVVGRQILLRKEQIVMDSIFPQSIHNPKIIIVTVLTHNIYMINSIIFSMVKKWFMKNIQNLISYFSFFTSSCSTSNCIASALAKRFSQGASRWQDFTPICHTAGAFTAPVETIPVILDQNIMDIYFNKNKNALST